MSVIKISELTAVETPVLTDVLPVVNEDETKKITLEQIVNVTKANITIISIKKVNVVSEVTKENVLYLVPTSDEYKNSYDEYILINGVPEKLGPQTIDLGDYATKSDVEEMIATSITDALEGEY